MAKTDPEEFFNEPKQHSRIKLEIFKKTLESSLAIAGIQQMQNCSQNQYCYIDLFAGPGQYQDDTLGSPILALDACSKQLRNPNSNLSKIKLILIERNESNIQKLRDNISTRRDQSLSDRLIIELRRDDWENEINRISGILNEHNWGFIFADQFSTELDIDCFHRTFQSLSERKDLLVLFNLQSLKRILGLANESAKSIIQRCCGIGLDDFTESNDVIMERIRASIRSKLGFKRFIPGVCLPSTKSQRLTVSDSFFLVLATSSFGVADKFLNAFAKEAKNIIENYEQRKLQFTEKHPNNIDNDIIDILKDEADLNLYDLMIYLTNCFISWGKAISRPGYAIPNISNTISALNRLSEKNRILVNATSQYFKTLGETKTLLKSKIKSNWTASRVQIQFVA